MPHPDSDSTVQQDGSPPHWGTEVRTFFNQHLPKRWIGRSGDADDAFCFWSPRPPDCTVIIWGYAKVC
ncbi:DDE_3 domain-containing protein [Trichonephila clavipes]|uniref:DDE_3 domain-containing protein n=1 Tax=Trichonephila clavipes TaxID=2585209 RepID=A0A8X6VEB9_TRICX|nr:DDE_3 domain-containing protein [Trichonephila clavipes]